MLFSEPEFDNSLSPFVRKVMVFEGHEASEKTNLPFFADGFPGLMYHRTPKGLIVHPHEKKMPALFIYGQTINPIEIKITGTYQVIVFQLYPFTLKSLFGIEPKSINDDCIDLKNSIYEWAKALFTLSSIINISDCVIALSEFIKVMVNTRKMNFDTRIISAIEKILQSNGWLNLAETANDLHITKRTFERRFLSETGLLPKQFAKIVQFQSSLSQLEVRDYTNLTDVVYENGYADQSHFIKVFKSFTGKTPGQFVRQ